MPPENITLPACRRPPRRLPSRWARYLGSAVRPPSPPEPPLEKPWLETLPPPEDDELPEEDESPLEEDDELPEEDDPPDDEGALDEVEPVNPVSSASRDRTRV